MSLQQTPLPPLQEEQQLEKTKVRGLRWYMASLLMLATTVNYLDRNCLSVAAPELKKTLGITEEQYSYIIMAFQFTYMLMQPVAGRVIDWLGTRLGFSLSVIWWSIANMLHAFAGGWVSFGFFRSLLGIGEAGNFPGAGKTIAEWFPPKERTIATGIMNIGSGTGAMIAPPLVAWIIYKWGWQEAFVITGAVGFLWVAVWRIFYHAPEQHPWLTREEYEHIKKGEAELKVEEDAPAGQEKTGGVWGLVLTQRNFWGLALTRFLAEPAWQFFSFWIPMYLATERGMNIKQIGMFAWVPFLAADLGSVVGGMLSPFFQKLGFNVLTSRKLAATTSALMMPAALFIAKAPTPGLAILYFSIASFAHQTLSATLLTMPSDLFPKRTVATANGLSGSIGYFGGLLATFGVGWLVTHVGYTPIFTAIGLMDLVGAALLWTLVRAPKTERRAA